MTRDFNNFWAEFQILMSELDHSKATLMGKLKYKLTLSLSQAIAGGVSQPKNIYKYAKHCQQAYQELKDIKQQIPAANSAGN